MNNDIVNRPAHYTDGKIEVINFIEDKGLNFHRGNAVKYIARAGKKDPAKEVEDLEKARWYINREIERLKGLRGQEVQETPKGVRDCAYCRHETDPHTRDLCNHCYDGRYWEAKDTHKSCPNCKHAELKGACFDIVGPCNDFDKWEAKE